MLKKKKNQVIKEGQEWALFTDEKSSLKTAPEIWPNIYHYI